MDLLTAPGTIVYSVETMKEDHHFDIQYRTNSSDSWNTFGLYRYLDGVQDALRAAMANPYLSRNIHPNIEWRVVEYTIVEHTPDDIFRAQG